MTRDGVWVHWFGMWFSSFVLLPIGVFITYKAMNDSVILNMDTYSTIFKRLFFIREKKKYPVKSVIIEHPIYDEIAISLNQLSGDIDSFMVNHKLLTYQEYWMDTTYDKELFAIKTKLDTILNKVSNSTIPNVLLKAEEFPILISKIGRAHV